MKKIKIFDVFVIGVTFILVIGIFFLPHQVPMHWDEHWNIDRYGSRYELLFFMLLPMILYYVMMLMKKIDPRKQNILKREKTYDMIQQGVFILFVLYMIFIYGKILYPNITIDYLLWGIMSVFFIFVGNYMPKIPQNYFLGVRTPWTMHDEDVWKKTHWVCGYLFIIFGIIIMLTAFIAPHLMVSILSVFAVVIVIFCFGYSYYLYRKRDKRC